MSSIIRIRASAKPADFFDEVVPEEGLELNGWRFTRHQFPDIGKSAEGLDVEVVSRWLYVETDSEPEQWASTLREKRPALVQGLQVLAAIRRVRLDEPLSFPMWFEDYEHNGRTGRIEPFKLNIGVGILNVRKIDADGNVIFDARVAQETYERDQARKVRSAAKAQIQEISKYVRFFDNPFFRRAWESYQLALGDDHHAMSHIYDVREAAKKGAGGSEKKLGISVNDWKRFGLILNNQAVQGGRHNGKHTGTIRPLTPEERSFLLQLGERMLFAFGDLLAATEKGEPEDRVQGGAGQRANGQIWS